MRKVDQIIVCKTKDLLNEIQKVKVVKIKEWTIQGFANKLTELKQQGYTLEEIEKILLGG